MISISWLEMVVDRAPEAPEGKKRVRKSSKIKQQHSSLLLVSVPINLQVPSTRWIAQAHEILFM